MEEDLLQMARCWASQSKAIKKYRMARATDVTEMIITDVQKLREIPVGETAVLVLHLKVVRTDIDALDCCDGCIMNGPGCDHCSAYERPDKEEVKFIKV